MEDDRAQDRRSFPGFLVVGAFVEGATGSGGQAVANMTGGVVGGIVVIVVMPIELAER